MTPQARTRILVQGNWLVIDAPPVDVLKKLRQPVYSTIDRENDVIVQDFSGPILQLLDGSCVQVNPLHVGAVVLA